MAANFTISRIAASVVVAIALSSCSPAEEEAGDERIETIDNENDTLAEVLAEMDDGDRIRSAVEAAGLFDLMDGAGIYTLLAPRDAAFDALGDREERLMRPDQRPLLVGLLRAHILPGHVTPEAVRTAIAQRGGSAEMTTLGGGPVRFTMDGDSIVVSDSDGASARIAGTALAGSNGAVIPIDAVLVPGGTAPAEHESADQ